MDLSVIFMLLAIAGIGVFGIVFSIFAAHAYFTVLQSTGAGAKQIVWNNEPVTERFVKALYFLWIGGLCLGPAYLIGKIADDKDLRLVIGMVVFWLLYPIVQLSSVCGTSIWIPLHPQTIEYLFRKRYVAICFYGLSAAVMLISAVGVRFVFLTAEDYVLLFVGSPVMVVGGLMYGRLLGRLAFVLMFSGSRTKRKKKRSGRAQEELSTQDHPIPAQPSTLPPIQTSEGNLSGYEFQTETPEERPRVIRAKIVNEPEPEPRVQSPLLAESRRWTEADEDDTPYEVNVFEGPPAGQGPAVVIEADDIERRLIARDENPKPPDHVWSWELLAFFKQPETFVTILQVSGLLFLVGLMVRIMRITENSTCRF